MSHGESGQNLELRSIEVRAWRSGLCSITGRFWVQWGIVLSLNRLAYALYSWGCFCACLRVTNAIPLAILLLRRIKFVNRRGRLAEACNAGGALGSGLLQASDRFGGFAATRSCAVECAKKHTRRRQSMPSLHSCVRYLLQAGITCRHRLMPSAEAQSIVLPGGLVTAISHVGAE